ncbi:MAG TPA: type II secretion system F family protein, partial [Nitrospiria bacterium]|nr:type II secretion system F family protein [Nitrospiria bacterium]
IALLRKQNILVTSIQQKARALGLAIPGLGGGVSDKDIVVFTRQFATMIDAGLPLVQCLEILTAQTENKVLAKTIGEVRQDVEAGSTYADALRKHPKVFDALYVNMVAAGEAGGILDTILNRLAKHIEKAMKLKKQIKTAMVYPAVIMCVAVIIIAILMVWVIPVFAKMFSDFGGALPAPTQLVVSASYFMKSNIIYMIIGVGLFIFAFRRFYRTPMGRKLVDRAALRLPVVGDLIRKAAVAKFTRTLGTLISSGVPILDGLSIVAKTAGNKIIEEAVMMTRQSISEGKTIAEPLGQTKVFPPMVVQMIAVGETTGALDAMLSKIADFYDEEVDAAVTALTSLLEPMLMVFLGVVIGFIVVAMYLPIFSMAGAVG